MVLWLLVRSVPLLRRVGALGGPGGVVRGLLGHGAGMLEKSTQMAGHRGGFSKLTRPAGDLRFLQRDGCGVGSGAGSAPGIETGLLNRTAPLILEVAEHAPQLVEAGQIQGVQVDAVVPPQAGELGPEVADQVELGGIGGHLRLGGGGEHFGDPDLTGLEEEGVQG